MMKILFTFLYLIIAMDAFSLTIITGKAETFIGEDIVLYVYEDLFTNTEKRVAVSSIKDDGSFRMEANLAEVRLGLLKINQVYTHIYISPGSTYEITMPERDQSGPMIQKQFVQCEFHRDGEDNMNQTIIEFNREFDAFVSGNYNDFMHKRMGGKAEIFKQEVVKKFSGSAFVNDYIRYTLATLDIATFQSRDKIYQEFLDKQSPLYQNPAYVDFFMQFYQDYLRQYSLKNDRIEKKLTATVNLEKSPSKLIELLTGEPLLQDKIIRELVLIFGLNELYHDQRFDQKSILFILKSLAGQSAVKEHQFIAANIISKRTVLIPGTEAPGFILLDRNDVAVNLSDFRGKYVYLDFWATWCSPCLKEMPLIAELKKKYGSEIRFVSISTDSKMGVMKRFLDGKNYDWIFLHDSKQVAKEAYQIKSLPTYFLIDPDGLLLESPAPKPGSDLEKLFIRISSNKNYKNRGYGY